MTSEAAASLRVSSPQEPGWTRRRTGRGFTYLDDKAQRLSDTDAQRARDLVIPPAWTDVWISPHPDSHLQAVGTDVAGRRQYLYHPQWRAEQDAQKFDRARRLGTALGRSRSVVTRHLDLQTRSREWACATAFRLLDLGCFRVGNDVYADEYGSFGLTTLQREHVKRRNAAVYFDFVGKSGVEHHVQVSDAQVITALERMRRRRRDDLSLLAFREENAWRELTSALVNEYIRDVTGLEATAKDFRTWHATVRAAASLAMNQKTNRDHAIRAAMEEVAALLGNTPTQARTSYVDPRVINEYEADRAVDAAVAARALKDQAKAHRPLELAVLKLLQEQ